MNETFRFWLTAYFCLFLVTSVAASTVVEDENVSIGAAEFKVLLSKMPSDVIAQLRKADPAERWTLLNDLVKNKRIAAEALKLSPDKDAADYWELELLIQTARLNFMEKRYLRELKMPDFSKLARERYDANKETIAKIPEGRRSSHILLLCKEGCDTTDKINEGREIRERLVSGANFEAFVEKYSGDPGSRKNKGKIDAWIKRLDGRFVR